MSVTSGGLGGKNPVCQPLDHHVFHTWDSKKKKKKKKKISLISIVSSISVTVLLFQDKFF